MLQYILLGINVIIVILVIVLVAKTKKHSGFYTPKLANMTNITDSQAKQCMYSRTGDVVNVSGQINMTPASTGDFDMRISTPVPTTFTDISQGAGTAINNFGQTAAVYAQPGGSSLRMQGPIPTARPCTWFFTVNYHVG